MPFVRINVVVTFSNIYHSQISFNSQQPNNHCTGREYQTQTENTSTYSDCWAAVCREVVQTYNLDSQKPAENVIMGLVKNVIFGPGLPKRIIGI